MKLKNKNWFFITLHVTTLGQLHCSQELNLDLRAECCTRYHLDVCHCGRACSEGLRRANQTTETHDCTRFEMYHENRKGHYYSSAVRFKYNCFACEANVQSTPWETEVQIAGIQKTIYGAPVRNVSYYTMTSTFITFNIIISHSMFFV